MTLSLVWYVVFLLLLVFLSIASAAFYWAYQTAPTRPSYYTVGDMRFSYLANARAYRDKLNAGTNYPYNWVMAWRWGVGRRVD